MMIGSSEEIPLAQRPSSLSRGISSDSMDVTAILGRDHADNLTLGGDANRQETSVLQKQVG